MKNIHFSLIIIVFIVLAYFGFRTTNHNAGNEAADVMSSVQDEEVLRYSATIRGRAYDPDKIEIPLGATVELTVTNEDNEQHGLFLSEFGVQEVVGPRRTKTIRFKANRLGVSSTFCSATHPEKLIITVI